MTGPAVIFAGVGKRFAHHAGPRSWRERFRPAADFTALDDVSFQVARGESLAIIGANGAGKSTLLSLAAGLLLPSSGRVAVAGPVAPLLVVGAGFHPDLTGAENLRVNAALLGMSRAEIAARCEAIVAFAGIADFLHEPLRTYSAGMVLRLGFAAAIESDPDILIVDEVLGVGDQAFYRRCLERIRGFRRRGGTLLFASHSPDLVRGLSDRTLWLSRGRVAGLGSTEEVLAACAAAGAPRVIPGGAA